MKNVLFYGFRHAHVEGLHAKAKENPRVKIVACLEENAEARQDVAKRTGITFDGPSYEYWLDSDVDIVAIGGRYGDRGRSEERRVGKEC